MSPFTPPATGSSTASTTGTLPPPRAPTPPGQLYGIDHWDAAAAQGAHAARAVLHDITGAPDPGPYTPDTGYTLTVYRQSAAA
ncbi:hypothetical protein ACX80S_18915 [Arthrobacter sp. RHLT1-20]